MAYPAHHKCVVVVVANSKSVAHATDTVFTIACMGIPFLTFLWTRGWTETVWTAISEGTLKKKPLAEQPAISEKGKDHDSV